MYRVKTSVASKDYQGEDGPILKGTRYYHFRPRIGSAHGTVRRFAKFPSKVARASSEYEEALFTLQATWESMKPEDVGEEEVQTLIGEVEEIRDGEQSKLDNLEEHNLQDGHAGQVIQDRITALEEFLDHLQSIDFETPDEDEESLLDQVLNQWPE